MKRLTLSFLLLALIAILLWSARPSRITVMLCGTVKTTKGSAVGIRTCAHLEREGSDCSDPSNCTNPQYANPDGNFRIQLEAVEHAAAYVEVKKEGYTTVRKTLGKSQLTRHQTIQIAAPIYLAQLYTVNKMDRMDDAFDPQIEVYGNEALEDMVAIKHSNIDYFLDTAPVRECTRHEYRNDHCMKKTGQVYRTKIKKHGQSLKSDLYYLFEIQEASECLDKQHLAAKEKIKH